MRLDCFSQDHVNSTIPTEPQQRWDPTRNSNPDPSTAFPAPCVLNRNPFFKPRLPRVSAINEESPSMVGVFVLQEYLFSKRIKHPARRETCRVPGAFYWNGMGLGRNPGVKAA